MSFKNFSEEKESVDQLDMSPVDISIDTNIEEKQHLEEAKPSIRASNIRWLVLALACFSCFGDYFAVDLGQSLQTYVERNLGLEDFQYNLIFSIFSIPNIVIPCAGGVIISTLGLRLSYNLFSILIILGMGITTVGAARSDFVLMLFGRFIFALGGDTIIITKSALIAKWFIGKELSFALGVGLSVARLGSSFSSFLAPRMYIWTGELYMPYLVGTFLCIASWIAVLVLNVYDKRADIEEARSPNASKASQTVSFKDIKSFNLLYYLLLINSVILYSAFFGLLNNLNNLIVSRFGFTPEGAGIVIPIIYVCSIVFTPIIATFVDKRGKRVKCMLIASIVFCLTHLMVAFLPQGTEEEPVYGVIFALLGVGLFYSIYVAVLWPSIPIVVGQRLMSLAYGLIFSVNNLVLAFVPLLLGSIHDKTQHYKSGYFWTEILLALLVAVGIVNTVWIRIEDKKKGEKLDKALVSE